MLVRKIAIKGQMSLCGNIAQGSRITVSNLCEYIMYILFLAKMLYAVLG